MFQNQIDLISDQNKQREKEAISQGNPPPPVQQFFVPRKIKDRFEEELAKSSKHSSKNGNRYSKSSISSTSFAGNNCLTRAISNLLKDKKVCKLWKPKNQLRILLERAMSLDEYSTGISNFRLS